MLIKVVSTFPLDHAPIYGNTFLQHCAERKIPLTLVHYEDFSSVPCHGETRIDAQLGGAGEDFELWEWRALMSQIDKSRIYRFQIGRFAWKVFAMTRKDLQKHAAFLVWLDADVVMFGDPDWGELISIASDVTYLGRSEWDHSETGFLGWNLRKRGADGLAMMRAIYMSGKIIDEEQWHDAWIFDRVRERLNLTCLNLSPLAKKLDAWGASPLAKWSDHRKGNRKFHEAHAAFA